MTSRVESQQTNILRAEMKCVTLEIICECTVALPTFKHVKLIAAIKKKYNINKHNNKCCQNSAFLQALTENYKGDDLQLACCYLCIPASPVPAEQVSSAAYSAPAEFLLFSLLLERLPEKFPSILQTGVTTSKMQTLVNLVRNNKSIHEQITWNFKMFSSWNVEWETNMERLSLPHPA